MDSDTSNGLTRTPKAWRPRDLSVARPGYPGPVISYYGPIPATHARPLPAHVFHLSHPHPHAFPPPIPVNHHPVSSFNQRPSSPSVLTTSSDDREEAPIVRDHHLSSSSRHHKGSVYGQSISRRDQTPKQYQIIPRSAAHRSSIVSYGPGPIRGYRPPPTVRSTRSFPGLRVTPRTSIQKGDPCPVHGSGHPHHKERIQYSLGLEPPRPIVGIIHPSPSAYMSVKRYRPVPEQHRRPSQVPLLSYPGNGSSIGLPALPPPSNQFNGRPDKSFGIKLPLPHYVGTMFRSPNIPTSFLPSGQVVLPTTTAPSIPFEIIKRQLAAAAHVNSIVYEDPICCKGHLIVLWIILSVITLGIISAIILGIAAV